LAALALEDVAPERRRIVREELGRDRRLDDPGLLLELALELARPPAGEARVDAAAADRLRQLVEVGRGGDEADVGDDDPGGLVGVGELAEDDDRTRLHRRAADDKRS